MYVLEFSLNSDYSGCKYVLLKDGKFIKQWSISYGYNTKEWQKKEKEDVEKMKNDLTELGVNFELIDNVSFKLV